MHLTGRRLRPEQMDDPDVDPRALADALAALERTNRLLGGTRAVIREFARWIAQSLPLQRDEPLRILDIGTGSADIPIALAQWAEAKSISLEITAIDLHEKTLAVARQRTEDIDAITVVRADALQLMDHFEPASFHYAHAGLFLHHLEDLDVMTVLRIMQRLTMRGLIWNDLLRSRFTKIAIVPFSWTGPAVFRHDSIASMHAGFTKREAIELAARVGLERVRFRSILFHRFILSSEHA